MQGYAKRDEVSNKEKITRQFYQLAAYYVLYYRSWRQEQLSKAFCPTYHVEENPERAICVNCGVESCTSGHLMSPDSITHHQCECEETADTQLVDVHETRLRCFESRYHATPVLYVYVHFPAP